jgi:hypothetical protein
MAGWGTGSFENDDAQNWLPQLASLSLNDLRPLLARAADNSDYLEAPESGIAIAAAEAVAALKGAPSTAAPKQITDWASAAKSQSNDGSLQALAALAARAVLRVRTNSELKDLWLQADGLNEWSANLRDLEQRLVAGETGQERPAPTASAEELTTEARALLRHTVATLSYRGGKAVRNAPASFANYRCGESSRTPGQILAHIGDLLDWALSIAEGRRQWHDATPLSWEQEIDRFFTALKTFDDYLASEAPLHISTEKLFQGPVADALTHVGQIAMLRRMAGVPIKGESYIEAEIATGQVGPDQPRPRKEFD